MLELPHVLVGAAIVSEIHNPLISLPLALASHFVVDLIPHWNPEIYREVSEKGKVSKMSNYIVIVDVISSLVFGLWLANHFLPDIQRSLVLIFACFLAVAPDVLEAPYYYFNFRPRILKQLVVWQHHHQNHTIKILGILIQFIVMFIALSIIFA